MEILVCDFCSSQPVTARYKAKDFLMKPIQVEGIEVTGASIGDWAACKECEFLIDMNRWDEVVKRAVEKFFEFHPYFVGIIWPATITEALWDAYAMLISGGFKKGEL